MTDNEIRIAIAEKCGRVRGFGSACPICGSLSSRHECFSDYPNDLNAVHEAEETIRGNPDLWVRWGNELFAVTKPNGDNPFACYHANSRQRAEALLRTWGLWKE